VSIKLVVMLLSKSWGKLLDEITAFNIEKAVCCSTLYKCISLIIRVRKSNFYLSTSGETIGLISFSNPDQSVVCKIISGMSLAVWWFINIPCLAYGLTAIQVQPV
jgi:hypothetical protein